MVLIISEDHNYREDCRAALLKVGLRSKRADGIIEALRELDWFRPDLIILDFKPYNLRRMKELAALRDKHGRIPLMLECPKVQDIDLLRDMAEVVVPRSWPTSKLIAYAERLLAGSAPVDTARSEIASGGEIQAG